MQISIKGIDHAIRTIERYTDINAKLNELAERLCREVGLPVIQSVHHGAYINPVANGYSIVAEGENVLFIEFGTGDSAGVMDALYDAVPPEVGQGTWSATHAQMYTRYGFWVFAGTIYHETPPHPVFYYAYRDMVEAIPRIAREVFAR